MSEPREVRWAHLHEIDHRTRVGSTAWFMNNSPNAQMLSAWRNLHRTYTHEEIHGIGTSYGHAQSSDMTLSQMIMQSRNPES
jgi:hypothetical protein